MAGVPVVNACGGKGECMQCRVKLLQGSARSDFEALFYLSQDEINQSFILACRTPVSEDIEVFVPGLRQTDSL
jgi:Na+-transporting NADH:ubiquinone oxidoreductase subunit NqrF